MCESISFLVFLIIIKILLYLILPIYILFSKRNFRYLTYINIFLVVLFLLLRLFNNNCILNSNISRINEISIKNNFKDTYDYSLENFSNEIYVSDLFKTYSNKNIKYYNLNDEFNKNKTFTCNNEKKYNKFYLENIYNIAPVLSYSLSIDINPNELLDYALEKNIVDCNKGIDTIILLDTLKEKYQFEYKLISPIELENYILNDHVVLFESKGSTDISTPLSCNIGYSVIYNVSDGDFILSSSNDKDYNYICPDNSIGFGSVIKANNNDNTWTLNSLNVQASKFIVIEKR